MEEIKIKLPFNIKKPVLALGSHTKNTICFIKGAYAHISPIHSDLSCPKDRDDFEKQAKIFLRRKPEIIANDIHPGYYSTMYASSLKSGHYRFMSIQHHHAHIAACMAESEMTDEKVIGVAFDGTGLGDNNTLWGAEIFYPCGYKGYRRAAHLKEISLVGAEAAIREPWRVAAIWLYLTFGEKFAGLNIDFCRKLGRNKWRALKTVYKADINSPRASSMGRFFDAVASIVLTRYNANFEAELAVELQRLASAFRGAADEYKFRIRDIKEVLVIDPLPVFSGIVEDLKAKEPKEKIAFRFHLTIAEMLKKTCLATRQKHKNNKVALSGGVFQNKLLLELSLKLLEDEGFDVFKHKVLSPNDSCVSLGQAIIAGLQTH